jgi:hypothetical protein
MPLATVDIDAIHEADPYGARCIFAITHRPDCIRLIEPLSIYDPPSLEYLRASGLFARRARLLGTKWFGQPQPVPDVRPPASYPDEAMSNVTANDVWMDARLPQNETHERQRTRAQQLERARGLYQFAHAPGLPAFVRDLPAEEAFSRDKNERMMWDVVRVGVELGIGGIQKAFDPSRRLQAYRDFFGPDKAPVPSVIERYASDEEFGRQRLNGINPFLIKRCDVIPDHFPVEQSTVAALLGDGPDLAALRESGRLYLLDLAILDGIEPVPGRYLTAPMCLFHVDDKKRLMPLAIQLGQSPAAGPIFTPQDDYWLWQTVKTHVQCADAQVQECVSHLLRTHMVMETIAIATHRRLSMAHPLHQLLVPHFRFTMAINHSARTRMLAPEGPIDRTMSVGAKGAMALCAKGWTEWSFDQYDLRNDLKSRGVDDPALLPGYYYRDDALKLWDVIATFVGEVVGAFYHDDGEVAGDPELQAWALELSDKDSGNFRGFANDGILTVERLAHIVTTIVFLATGEHSGVNNGQYDLYSFIPNIPGSIFAPPPTSKAPLTEQSLFESLPRPVTAAKQIAMVYLLSEPTETPIGAYSPRFFAGNPEIEPIVERFENALRKVAKTIEARNAGLATPYLYMHPASIYPSIEI